MEKAVILCWIIAAATMIWATSSRCFQENLKRLLAYSSIAHAGYLMIGVTVAFANGQHGDAALPRDRGDLFYLVAYALMTLGAFGVIIGAEDRGPAGRDGRRARRPGLDPSAGPALALAVCLLSLSGIPPLMGFWAKFEIFTSALAARGVDESWSFLVLAVIGVLNSAVGAYYYLRIVVLMYLSPAQEDVQVRGGWPVSASVAACAGLTVVLGLFWGVVAETAHEAARAAAAHPDPRASAVAAVAESSAARLR